MPNFAPHSTSMTELTLSKSHRTTIERFCSALHALPRLEEVQISAMRMEDAWIVPLKGHRTLRILHINRVNKLSPRCITTLRTLPALQELQFSDDPFAPDSRLSPEDVQALANALPSVRVYMNGTEVIKSGALISGH
jgi:hypothetical protein